MYPGNGTSRRGLDFPKKNRAKKPCFFGSPCSPCVMVRPRRWWRARGFICVRHARRSVPSASISGVVVRSIAARCRAWVGAESSGQDAGGSGARASRSDRTIEGLTRARSGWMIRLKAKFDHGSASMAAMESALSLADHRRPALAWCTRESFCDLVYSGWITSHFGKSCSGMKNASM